MSAETQLECFKLAGDDGQYVIAVCRGGDTVEEYQGQVVQIVGVHGSYEAMKTHWEKVRVPRTPDYVYTEIHTSLPSKHELDRQQFPNLFLLDEPLVRRRRRRHQRR